MPDCRCCNKPMTVLGHKWVCTCGYQRDIPERVPSQAELLAENSKLKQENVELKREIKRLRNREDDLIDTKVAIEDVVDTWGRHKKH